MYQISHDDQRGMDWWNSLDKVQREYWCEQSGSAVPAEVWSYYKKGPGRAGTELVVKRRGRPASGNALTPAQRKAAQRNRWKDMTRYPHGGWEAIPAEILADWMKRAISAGWPELVADICAEATRRAALHDKS